MPTLSVDSEWIGGSVRVSRAGFSSGRALRLLTRGSLAPIGHHGIAPRTDVTLDEAGQQRQPTTPPHLTAGAVNTLIQQATTRAGVDDDYSAHSLRAGFVTYAHMRGATDRAIAHQTRHRLLTSVGTYIRVHTAGETTPPTQIGL